MVLIMSIDIHLSGIVAFDKRSNDYRMLPARSCFHSDYVARI